MPLPVPIPARPLLLVLTGWLLLAVAVVFWPSLLVWWAGIAACLGAVVLADAIDLLNSRRLEVRREVPGRLALGVEQEIPLHLHMPGNRAGRIRLWDSLPQELVSADFPWDGRVPPRVRMVVHVRVLPVARGNAEFGPLLVAQTSRLGFWIRRYSVNHASSVRVYPNYEPVVRMALLAMDHNSARMGIRQINRPGQSREFRQLRDYQDGDAPAQIDWKATSRRLILTSREFEEQRNQTIILMIDCGRRLQSMDGAFTQFDHSLNALLLLAFIALRRGDHVGVMSFGSDTPRWLSPVKGQHSITTILNHLYDYQPSSSPGDFSEAATHLLSRWAKRALLVIATNLRSEEENHFKAPLALLRRKHLVVVASLQEKEVVHLAGVPVQDLPSAVRYGATQQYFEERRRLLGNLHQGNILTIDAPAEELPVALGNLYLGIKKRGLL